MSDNKELTKNQKMKNNALLVLLLSIVVIVFAVTIIKIKA